MKRQRTRAELKIVVRQLWAQIRYMKRKELAGGSVRQAALQIEGLADSLRIVGEKHNKVGFPFFPDIEGGPLWFHYDCRCAAEADIIKRRIKDEWRSMYREIL